MGGGSWKLRVGEHDFQASIQVRRKATLIINKGSTVLRDLAELSIEGCGVRDYNILSTKDVK